MNASSVNHNYLDNWDVCFDHGYVGIVLFFAAQALCFLLGTPSLVWCLWFFLSGSLTGSLKPTQVFPINLYAVELVFCVQGLLNVVSFLFNQNAILQKAGYFLYILSWTCRPLIQSCVCVVWSTMVWVLLLAYACSPVPLLMGYQNITAYVLISVYCLGVAIISLCCFFILRVLKQPGPGEVEGGRGGEKKRDDRPT